MTSHHRFDRVHVTWVDSISEAGWVDLDEARRRAATPFVMRTESIGYLLSDLPDYLLLAQSVMRDGDLVQGLLQIPRAAVLTQRKVK